MLPISVFRVRVRLRMTGAARLQGCHFAALYGLLAHAHGLATRQDASLPDGLWLDAPEQARTELSAGNEYAFGFTLLAPTGRDAARRVQSLVRGVSQCGTNGLAGAVFGRNFRVAEVEDLIAATALAEDADLQPISESHFTDEVRRASDLTTVTLRMTSPLRMARPKNLRDGGHAFLDRRWFRPPLFLQRVGLRLQRLGWTGAVPEFASDAAEPNLIDNQLVWLDLSYGDGSRRKLLGGGVGNVIIAGVPIEFIPALVWGQYVGVGESTRFGFGRYRIVELGPEPFACPRSTELLDVALSSARLDRAAERYQLEPGAVSQAAQQVQRRTYAPQPPYQFELRESDRSRVLNIPQAVDRALQSAVCDWLAPVLEGFFEESSLAFRKGLGRHRAARRLEAAFADGYRWAVRSDVHRFFDSVDHAELQRRLRAYLTDDGLVELLMQWVRAGSPEPERGLPTGAPISPLLANLFLDHFDECLERDGGRLVRYADDFLVLVREQAEADRLLAAARRAAAELQLSLNADKTAILNLAGPFDFLGFRFERREQWEITEDGAPKCVDEFGWRESSTLRPASAEAINLPGEGPATTITDRTTVILGPRLEWLGVQDGRLAYRYDEGEPRRGDV
ncbi:MAG: CRISPR system precrRNA processing endoribonuclease RAMP protein Cas6, partial [Planctomycetaceae bacterium]|nr:CRISPR system precrRNA processing endoribonuclease RAMP protein Cas6 [Planctomycetaceae bacterium]